MARERVQLALLGSGRAVGQPRSCHTEQAVSKGTSALGSGRACVEKARCISGWTVNEGAAFGSPAPYATSEHLPWTTTLGPPVRGTAGTGMCWGLSHLEAGTTSGPQSRLPSLSLLFSVASEEFLTSQFRLFWSLAFQQGAPWSAFVSCPCSPPQKKNPTD